MNKPITPFHLRPIQVKTLNPTLNPEIWKANTIHEALSYVTLKIQSSKRSGTQWWIQFTDKSIIAGELL